MQSTADVASGEKADEADNGAVERILETLGLLGAAESLIAGERHLSGIGRQGLPHLGDSARIPTGVFRVSGESASWTVARRIRLVNAVTQIVPRFLVRPLRRPTAYPQWSDDDDNKQRIAKQLLGGIGMLCRRRVLVEFVGFVAESVKAEGYQIDIRRNADGVRER